MNLRRNDAQVVHVTLDPENLAALVSGQELNAVVTHPEDPPIELIVTLSDGESDE